MEIKVSCCRSPNMRVCQVRARPGARAIRRKAASRNSHSEDKGIDEGLAQGSCSWEVVDWDCRLCHHFTMVDPLSRILNLSWPRSKKVLGEGKGPGCAGYRAWREEEGGTGPAGPYSSDLLSQKKAKDPDPLELWFSTCFLSI